MIPRAKAADQNEESTETGKKGLFYLIFLAALACLY